MSNRVFQDGQGSRDPYGTLGVAKTASEDDVKKAYRLKAMSAHPDKHGNADWAKRDFQEIAAAYEILIDPVKRASFDRFGAGEAASGAGSSKRKAKERYPWDDFNWAGFGARKSKKSTEEGTDGKSAKPSFTKYAKANAKPIVAAEGYKITLSYIEAIFGGICLVILPDGSMYEMPIAADVKSGRTVRAGLHQMAGGRRMSRVVEIKIMVGRDKRFKRVGNDIKSRIPITLRQSYLGGKLKVETIHGPVAVNLKAPLGGQGLFSIPRYGVNGGKMIVEYFVDLPKTAEPELEQFLRSWEPQDERN